MRIRAFERNAPLATEVSAALCTHQHRRGAGKVLRRGRHRTTATPWDVGVTSDTDDPS